MATEAEILELRKQAKMTSFAFRDFSDLPVILNEKDRAEMDAILAECKEIVLKTRGKGGFEPGKLLPPDLCSVCQTGKTIDLSSLRREPKPKQYGWVVADPKKSQRYALYTKPEGGWIAVDFVTDSPEDTREDKSNPVVCVGEVSKFVRNTDPRPRYYEPSYVQTPAFSLLSESREKTSEVVSVIKVRSTPNDH